MKRALILFLLASPLLAQEHQTATLVSSRTVNEWCHHCPDWNKTRYSFQTADGMTYVAETHRKLDIAVNGRNVFRFERTGHVGDHLYVVDDSGKEQKLKIVERIAPK